MTYWRATTSSKNDSCVVFHELGIEIYTYLIVIHHYHNFADNQFDHQFLHDHYHFLELLSNGSGTPGFGSAMEKWV